MGYWQECVYEALEDAGLKATDKQIETIAGWVEGAHDNYGMATGLDVADSNYVSDDKKELEALRLGIENNRKWVATTKPCPSCHTEGTVKDGCGRGVRCHRCSGEGRI